MTQKYKYTEFSEAILKLPPQEFLGVCNLLGVDIYTAEKDKDNKPIPKDGYDLINEVLLKYETKNRLARRRLLKIIK